MADPSDRARGGHLADDEEVGDSQPDERSLQVALPVRGQDEHIELADPLVSPLQAFDPELDAFLAEIMRTPDPAPVAGNGQVVRDDAGSFETAVLSNGDHVEYLDYPARNTRRRTHEQAAAPAPYYARGGRRGRGGRGSPGSHRDHIASERNRRREMNNQFAALRLMLPVPAEVRMDRSAIVLAAINHIATLEMELRSLIREIENLARIGHIPAPPDQELDVRVDHTPRRTLTPLIAYPTMTAHPSTLASFIGANVSLNVVYQTPYITVSSRHGAGHMRLYARVLSVLHEHRLEVVSGTLAARRNAVVYTFQCQPPAYGNLMSGDLHAALQNAVNEYNRGA